MKQSIVVQKLNIYLYLIATSSFGSMVNCSYSGDFYVTINIEYNKYFLVLRKNETAKNSKTEKKSSFHPEFDAKTL
jgi:hypothetical protein